MLLCSSEEALLCRLEEVSVHGPDEWSLISSEVVSHCSEEPVASGRATRPIRGRAQHDLDRLEAFRQKRKGLLRVAAVKRIETRRTDTETDDAMLAEVEIKLDIMRKQYEEAERKWKRLDIAESRNVRHSIREYRLMVCAFEADETAPKKSVSGLGVIKEEAESAK